MARQRRYSETERRCLLEEWRASGQTAREFAKARGLGADNLYRWSWEQRRSPTGSSEHSGFMEVRLAHADPEGARVVSGGVEVVLGNGRTIRILGEVDPQRLRALVEVLESC